MSGVLYGFTVALLVVAALLAIGTAVAAFRADPRRPELFAATGAFA